MIHTKSLARLAENVPSCSANTTHSARSRCPKCGCTAYQVQGTESVKYKGQDELVSATRRKCKSCGCKYTVNPKERNNPPCPYCGSKSRKTGFAKNGARKYLCTSCKKNFQTEYEGGELYRISEHQRKMVFVYLKAGFSKRFVAKLLGIGATSIKRILEKGR